MFRDFQDFFIDVTLMANSFNLRRGGLSMCPASKQASAQKQMWRLAIGYDFLAHSGLFTRAGEWKISNLSILVQGSFSWVSVLTASIDQLGRGGFSMFTRIKCSLKLLLQQNPKQHN